MPHADNKQIKLVATPTTSDAAANKGYVDGLIAGVLPIAGHAGFSIAGRASTGTGAVADIAIAASRLVGRDGPGDISGLTVAGGLEFTGAGGIQRSALTGDVTATAGSGTTTIANSAVTLAKMANLAAQRLLGNDAGTGAPVALTVGSGISFSGSGGIVGDYITGVSGSTTWKGSTVNGNSLTIDASFGSDGGPLLMRASRWSFDIVSALGALTASTEQVAWDHKARTAKFATGALATQRETVFRAPTYEFVGASTITKASTVSITGAPAAGTNATITTRLALEVEAGDVKFAADLAVGDDLTVADQSTLSGHVDANAGLAVSGGILTANRPSDVAFAVLAGDATFAGAVEFQFDVTLDTDTFKDGGSLFFSDNVNQQIAKTGTGDLLIKANTGDEVRFLSGASAELLGYGDTEIGIFSARTTQFTYGSATAGGTYGAAEQTMLQRLWDMLRAGTGGFGLNT